MRRGSSQDRAPWWTEALELERADRLEEAEQVIRRALEPRGWPWEVQIAGLYEDRARRLAAAGRLAEARAAAETGFDWMMTHASYATSGGEGLERSEDARRFREEIESVLAEAAREPER